MDTRNENHLSAAQLRKIRKPLVERRRRERINESLDQLKSLLLQVMNKNEAQFQKIEKADILEMAVAHFKNVRVHTPRSGAADGVRKYRDGFRHCVQEVHRCMASVPGTRPEVHHQVMNHLNSCMMGLPQCGLQYPVQGPVQTSPPQTEDRLSPTQKTSPMMMATPITTPPQFPLRVPAHYPASEVDINNNLIMSTMIHQSGSRYSSPAFSTSSQEFSDSKSDISVSSPVSEKFFTPISVDVDNSDIAPKQHSDITKSPTVKKLDFEQESTEELIISSKQAWIQKVYEDRKRVVSGDVWRPW